MNDLLPPSDYRLIITAVKEYGGVDLDDYAVSSLRRRLIRYITTNKIPDINHLVGRIRNGNGFLDHFIGELTVHTTEMFRDPSFWTKLRKDVMPDLAQKDRINIWHAACSTGEEVYSMAILLKELGLLDRSSLVATDISDKVMGVAARGEYSLRNQKVNSANYESFDGMDRLEQYYKAKGHVACYDTSLIRNVEFKRHNLVQDGALPGFDLLICRNVLIYFNFDLQERVIRVFNQSLHPMGFLGIGSKESIMWCKSGRNFSPLCMQENIHQKKREASIEVQG